MSGADAAFFLHTCLGALFASAVNGEPIECDARPVAGMSHLGVAKIKPASAGGVRLRQLVQLEVVVMMTECPLDVKEAVWEKQTEWREGARQQKGGRVGSLQDRGATSLIKNRIH